MKKQEALNKIKNHFFSSTNAKADLESELMLNFFTQELKLSPPPLSGDFAQALMDVYIDPNFNMWEDDFMKDPKLVQALNKIQSRKLKA